MSAIHGKALVFGNNINTDLILPGKYMYLTEPSELAKVCMEGIEENFRSKIQEGDIFVAGSNFGSGSSREHAPVSIKGAGVSCVIAKSFARIFFRNAINIGLPVVESVEAVDAISEGEELQVNLKEGFIKNLTKNETYPITPFPPFLLDILNAGGVINYFKAQQ